MREKGEDVRGTGDKMRREDEGVEGKSSGGREGRVDERG